MTKEGGHVCRSFNSRPIDLPHADELLEFGITPVAADKCGIILKCWIKQARFQINAVRGYVTYLGYQTDLLNGDKKLAIKLDRVLKLVELFFSLLLNYLIGC
jgi:hypothetical protein